MQLRSPLDSFRFHGVRFTGSSGDQVIADCKLCGKEAHFYVNQSNGLWKCMVCQAQGISDKFLELLSRKYAAMLSGIPLANLVANRGKISSETMKHWGLGWTGDRYTVPVRDAAGNFVDLRICKLGDRLLSTKGLHAGLFGAHTIKPGKQTIYVCEGEWDMLALYELAHQLKKDVQIVGVPGAGTFRPEWVDAFRGRDVITLYDADEAGENGERVALERLQNVAKSIQFIHWPEGLKSGFDVRDWVNHGLRIGKPQGCWDNLHKLLKSEPRKATPEEKVATKAIEARKSKGPASAEEVQKVYSRWLQIDEPDILKVMFGTCFANRMEGEPVWMFLVAPPGGMKSELLMSLKESPTTYATTSLTPHTLVSGSFSHDGKDPSLLPLLDQKMLIIKDFTTILSMHFIQRDEIFGIFRDLYDGNTSKQFGTGVRREYNVKFGILAGVTNAIEAFGVVHQSLGERFLKFRASEDHREKEGDKIRRALSNINHEVAMREELTDVAARCLDREVPADPPRLGAAQLDSLVALAQFTSMLRGVVSRDRFDKSVQYRPSYEVGTRLAKQLAKLGSGMAFFSGHHEVGDEEYQILKRVALDTAPDRIEVIVRKLYQNCHGENAALRTQKVSELTRLPQATIFRVMQDLELLNIVDRTGDGTKHCWMVSRRVRGLLQKAHLYEKAPISVATPVASTSPARPKPPGLRLQPR